MWIFLSGFAGARRSPYGTTGETEADGGGIEKAADNGTGRAAKHRVTLALLILLLATNGLWLLTVRRGGSRPEPEAPETGGGEGASGLPVALPIPGTIRAGESGARRDAPEPARPVSAEDADRRRREWSRAVKGSAHPATRRRAVEQIHLALAGEDPNLVLAGLLAIPRIEGGKTDPGSLRPLVERRLGDPDPGTRSAALLALAALGPERADVERILPMARDPDPGVRQAAPRALLAANRREADGTVGSLFLDLLRDEELSVRFAALRALETAVRLGPEVEMQLVSMVESGDGRLSLRALTALARAKHEQVPAVLDGPPSDPGRGRLPPAADGAPVPSGALIRLAGDRTVPEPVRRAARDAVERSREGEGR